MMNNYAQPVTVGRQQFDGLGRPLSIQCGGRITEHHYAAGQLQPTHNILADGKRVDFRYLKALENLVEQILPAGESAHGFSYDRTLGTTISASGPLGVQQMTFTAAGKPQTDTWTVDGQAHVTTWRYSLGGLQLGFEDAAGVDHQRAFDSAGRLQRITVGNVTSEIGYDAFSRPHTYTTRDTVSGTRLTQTLTYDGLGREHTRTYDAVVEGESSRKVQTLTYTDLDQLKSRHWDDSSVQGEERFTYDRHGRLNTYEADLAVAPKDPFGNLVVKQVLRLDALDCYIDVVSTFADNSSDTATFEYQNSSDPTQVTRITHTHASWPRQIDLAYDARGRLERDSLGRVLTWDGQDRLLSVSYQGQTCTYGYDPAGNLCDRRVDGQLTRSFHSAKALTHELRGEEQLRLIGEAGQLFAVDRLAAGVHRATLLGCDAQGSVRLEADEELRQYHYTAHGADAGPSQSSANPFGFAGERREPLTGWYIAAGYRPYDPVLMIFLAPDSASPFGRGGLNPYTYCGGDPVNRFDPDGHSWMKWLGIGLAALALAMTVIPILAPIGMAVAAGAFTAGAAGAGVTASLGAGLGAGLVAGITSVSTVSGAVGAIAAVASTVKLATSITILAMNDPDAKASKILGYVDMAAGIVGGAASAVKGGIAIKDVISTSFKELGSMADASAAIASTITTLSTTTMTINNVVYSDTESNFDTLLDQSTPVSNYSTGARQIGPQVEQASATRKASLPNMQRAETGPAQRVAEIISRPQMPSTLEKRGRAANGDKQPISRQFQ
ncbi:RHS repeat-associated core domain-containing protein [Pseudomonas sp. EMN2]|uniref:RHS repeat-associated core domain-containing protein n=1 Tax=Pseudomonas sp. EMN2 TaxID=2615212 RepID=UPI00129A99BE|nr:RHS repeat-associated core domain-containing protein [Pseudomonas sp. EMN2]